MLWKRIGSITDKRIHLFRESLGLERVLGFFITVGLFLWNFSSCLDFSLRFHGKLCFSKIIDFVA